MPLSIVEICAGSLLIGTGLIIYLERKFPYRRGIPFFREGFWTDVIGYALSVHNAILKVNNSNEYSIHPKKILEFYIRQLLEWTKQAYKSEMVVMGKESYKIYKSYDVVSLKKMCKEKGIKNYSKCNKEQLITLLNVIEKKVEIKDESEAQHLKSIKKIVDYYVKNADKYPWFFKCCFSKL
jgi:hypothetical protein